MHELRDDERLRVGDVAFLLYPEWQGYGVDAAVHAGALRMARELFPEIAFTTVDAPADEPLAVRDGVLGLDSIAARFRTAIALLRESAPAVVGTVGGTCGVEAAPVAYLNERYAGDLAVVWFDAHGDLNTPASSPSGHFHGMVLRTLTGDGPREYIDEIRRPLLPRQIVLAGTRDLDPPEKAFIRDSGIAIIAPEAMANPRAAGDAIELRRFRNLYVHVDLDCFRPDEIPDTLMRTPGGPAFESVLATVDDLRRRFQIAGWSIVEHVDRGGGSIEKLRPIVDLWRGRRRRRPRRPRRPRRRRRRR